MNVKKTYNYDQFKNIVGNRVINQNHVNKLKGLITTQNKSEYFPILVNKDFEVIDGQHRLQALKELELPVYYTLDPRATLRDVTSINSSSKVWNFEDYLQSFIKQNIKEYQIFEMFRDSNNLKNNLCLHIISPSSPSEFKDGLLVIRDLEEAQKIVDIFNKIRKYFDGGRERYLAYGISVCLNNDKFDVERFIHKFQQLNETYLIPQNAKGTLRLFEDVYNHKLRSNKLRLDVYE